MEGPKRKHLAVDVLCLVLQHLKTKQRLSCGRVSHAWLAASRAATTHVCITKTLRANTSAPLAAWLCRNSRYVHSIALTDNSRSSSADVWLPLHQLNQLQILTILQPGYEPLELHDTPCNYMWTYSTAIATSYSKVLEANPLVYLANTLTSLTLQNVHHRGFDGSWKCLGALTALQQLDLQQALDKVPNYTWGGFHFKALPAAQAAVACNNSDIASPAGLGSVQLQLESLTQLHLAWEMDITLRAVLGLMTQLRQLKLQRRPGAEHMPAAGITSAISLPSELTSLDGPVAAT
jgi:hypothetical protein